MLDGRDAGWARVGLKQSNIKPQVAKPILPARQDRTAQRPLGSTSQKETQIHRAAKHIIQDCIVS